jgi:Outer membrane protein beta-barrel family/Carboxypeptidase regulatory-like domain
MKKLTSTAILLLCCYVTAIAQSFTVKGSVVDTLNSANLPYASVVFMRASDSVIQTFARTRQDGSFSAKLPATGKYIMRITFPSFADYIDNVTVKGGETDLGKLPMVSKEHLLKEAVITQQIAAIKIKGDTTEYMADSFKVKPNATVEDLLKRLPGIQVDKNGQITAQGETVQKILVDGEEFFSDDPKVVTQGLQANAVQKVQVYNKKSDQAEFTGIDDGQKTKTINLELKEDKKKGYFGKLDLGGGTDGYYQDQGMINDFKGKMQLSAFGIMSNTDKIGLGWQDKDKYSSGNGTTEITDDGGIMTTWSGGDQDFGGWDGRYNGQGLPQTWTGGVHFADKWDEDKDHVTANYRYADQNVDISSDNITQYMRNGDTSTVNNTVGRQSSRGDRHAADAMYEWKVDSNTTIKLSADGGMKHTQAYSNYNTSSLLQMGDAIDTLYNNNRTIVSDTWSDYIKADLLVRKKFAKVGRTLSLDVKENYKTSSSDGTLLSSILPSGGIPLPAIDSSALFTHQKKADSTHTLAFSAKATYTEPLSKKVFLQLDYGITVNNSRSINNSYDSSRSEGRFDSLDQTYSSNYKYNIFSNIGGASLKFVYKKVNFSFGGDISNATFHQYNVYDPTQSKDYAYLNFFPNASFKYKISNQSSLNLNYNGSTQDPSITQIQPLKQNTDPTNITIGNPALKQEFIHTISATYNDYKVLTNRYIWLNGTMRFMNNGFSTSQHIFANLDTTQTINSNGDYTGWLYGGYGFKLSKIDMNIGIHASSQISHTNNIFNYQTNVSDNNSYSLGLYINKYKKDKFEFSFDPNITYNDNKATISTFTTSYWSSSNDVSGSYQLPHKFEIGTDVDVMIRQKTVIFTSNNNVVKWNAYIAKKFLKNDQLELRASVFDILNQNIGYSRNASGITITQSDYNTIRRYGMLNLVWNFTHTPAGAAPTQGNAIIIKQ